MRRDGSENGNRGIAVMPLMRHIAGAALYCGGTNENGSRGSVIWRDSIENDSRGSVVLHNVVKVMTCSIYTGKQVALELRGSRFSSLSQ